MPGRILVIDDEPQITRVLRASLSAQGFDVRTANDPEEGLLLFRDWSPDLVVTDLMMPGMNGAELIHRLTKTHPQLPVIVASGAIDVIAELMGQDSFNALGIRATLMKPFKLADLVGKTKELILLAEQVS